LEQRCLIINLQQQLYTNSKNIDMSELVVNLENVNIYQSGSLILQDVNFKVEKGEFVYLVGKTGTGKSSLLKTWRCGRV